MDTDIWRFLVGCAGDTQPTPVFFAVEPRDAADAGANETQFCVYYQDQWYSYGETPQWSAVAIVAARYPGETQLVVAMSGDSSLWEMRPKERLERLTRIGDYTAMTNLANIDNTIYACGMGRVVLRREADGQWNDLSAPWPDLAEGVIGFTALAALHPRLIYAAGWQGEIWMRDSSGWRREDTPTNANFNALALSPEEEVFAAGDNGVLLRGRQGHWSVVDTQVDLNLTDVCWHAGDIFVSSDFDVYRLTPSGLVSDLNQQNETEDVSCLKLISAADQSLYSVGPSDVFRRIDGVWHRIA
jgi:hypothetical protein